MVDRRVLKRYQVMAYTTAVLLLILVFVAIPLQVWGHTSLMAKIVGTLHGYLYLVYLLAAFDLTRKLHVRLLWMILVLLAGTIPFGAFVAERKLTQLYDRTEAAAPVAAASASGDPTGR